MVFGVEDDLGEFGGESGIFEKVFDLGFFSLGYFTRRERVIFLGFLLLVFGVWDFSILCSFMTYTLLVNC